MLQIRENLFIGSNNIDEIDFVETKINKVFCVGGTVTFKAIDGVGIYYFPLKTDRRNPSHIKDLACHCPKYMCQNGDVVLIVDGENGLGAAAYVAARLVCELEGKSIYDVFMEIKEKAPTFDIGAAYY